MTTIVGIYTTAENSEKAVVIAADRLIHMEVERTKSQSGQSEREEVHTQESKIHIGPNFAFAFSGNLYSGTLESFLPYLKGESIDPFLKEIKFKDIFRRHPGLQFQRALIAATIAYQKERSSQREKEKKSSHDFFSEDFEPSTDMERVLSELKIKSAGRSDIEKLMASALSSYQSSISMKPIEIAVTSGYFQELSMLNAYFSTKESLFNGFDTGLDLILATNYSENPELYIVNNFGAVTSAKKDADEDPIIYKGSGSGFVKSYIDDEKFRKYDQLKNVDLHNLNLKDAKLLALTAVNHSAMPDPNDYGDPTSGFETDLVVITKNKITTYIDYINKSVREFRIRAMEELANMDDREEEKRILDTK